MNIFIQAFNKILYQPLFNALILLYQYLPGHDFGVAVIVLTLIIRFLLYPFTSKSIKSQKALSDIQPKIKEIQNKYKDNKEKQAKAMMELYQKEQINPFSGCLPLLVQLPILIGLFRVFWRGFGSEQMAYLYSFVSAPASIDQSFLGLVNLSQPNPVLAILAGLFQFLQTKTISSNQKAGQKKSGFGAMFQKQMLYFFPAFTVLIVWRLPSAIALYWIISTSFMVGQQFFIKRKRANSE